MGKTSPLTDRRRAAANPPKQAVRLALAMGEVVQRAGSAFFIGRESSSDYLKDMVPW